MLESLASNTQSAESELWVFCEGAKHANDLEAVMATREVVHSRQWCGSMHVVEREKNLGCANSIIAGIEAVLEKHDRIIVLEDDLVVSPHFLAFMNEGLERYSDEPRVMQIAGYMFPVETSAARDAFLLPFTNSWGWATWRDSWVSGFDRDLGSLKWLDRWWWRKYRFNLYGAYDYRAMLDQYINHQIDAWDIRWYLGTFRKNALTLYPRISLVANEGFAGGTHTGDSRLRVKLGGHPKALVLPGKTEIDRQAFKKIRQFFST